MQLAGLCHDLGHGPFSHLFESVVRELQEKKESGKPWHHENNTIKMLNYIYFDEKTGVKEEFSYWGLDDIDMEFVKSLVKGDIDEVNTTHFLLCTNSHLF